MTAIDENGKICRQGKVANQLEAISEFINQANVNRSIAAVLEATRNNTV